MDAKRFSLIKGGNAAGPGEAFYDGLFYTVSWELMEDEELPFLDPRLVAAMNGRNAALAIDRMTALVEARQRRRTVARDEVAAALVRAGLDPLALPHPGPTPISSSSDGVALGGNRRREGWPWVDGLFMRMGAPFGRERRIRNLRGELLVHTLAIDVLELLRAQLDWRRRRLSNPATSRTARGLQRAQALLDRPVVAALGAAFSGFNTAYLLPQHAYQAELLSAAAWLGWKLEGCHAPLPHTAAHYLKGMGETYEDWSWPLQGEPDPQLVLRLSLALAGISIQNLEKHAHDEWPSPPAGIDLRPKGRVDEPLCSAFVRLLEN